MEYLAGDIEIENNPIDQNIWDNVTDLLDQFDGIIGYRLPSLGFVGKEIPSFIIRSKSLGLVLIDVISEKIIQFDEDGEYWKTQSGDYIYSPDLLLNIYTNEVRNVLQRHNQLFNVRTSDWVEPIPFTKFLIFTQNTNSEVAALNESTNNPLLNSFVANDNLHEDIKSKIKKIPTLLSNRTIDIIDAVLDGSEVFSKVKKKKIEVAPKNINEFITKSLDYTFKLDVIQRQVALQVPPGPQRIRGLAGTGKTVILCMKAAMAHRSMKDQKILFVFNTQSMYNMVRELITEYYFSIDKSMPNWKNLHIFHAWGGSTKPGVYYNTANSVGVTPQTYMGFRSSQNALDMIYTNLLDKGRDRIQPIYDMVLIDEAQDFSPAFFETIYHLTKPVDGDDSTKKIIWAYDEFQSLTDINIAQPEELFGKDKNGNPNMLNSVLEGEYKGKIKKDFVLPNSYRNPRITLMIAHGLALGLYSKNAKVPMKDRSDYLARGYDVLEPAKQYFIEGDTVKVERPEKNSKNELERLIKESGTQERKLVQFKKYLNISNEMNEVIKKVMYLINEQKVVPEEIVIINLDTKNSKLQFEYIRQQLDIRGVKAITPGYVEPTDSFKEPGYITLSTTFRAKGNEANIVFIINSQRVITDKTYKMRNAMFVSITRSRGWCYISGNGPGIEFLEDEFNSIIQDYPRFIFTFPNEAQIERKMTIIQSSNNVEKADSEIDTLLSDDAYRALLLERIASDPALLKEISKIPNSGNDN